MNEQWLAVKYRDYMRDGWIMFANDSLISPLMNMLLQMEEDPVCIQGLGRYACETVICIPDLVPGYFRQLKEARDTYKKYIDKIEIELKKIEESGHGQIQGKVE